VLPPAAPDAPHDFRHQSSESSGLASCRAAIVSNAAATATYQHLNATEEKSPLENSLPLRDLSLFE